MSTISEPASRSDYRILSVIGVGHCMSHIYYLVLPPLFVPLREAFNVSYAELGMALAVMSLASAVLQVPIGFLVDKIGARVMLTGGLAIVATATALMGLCTSFPQLLALCVIAGAGNAVFHPTDYAILNSSISAGRMGRAFSIHTFTGQVGSAMAPAVTIALAQAFGWRTALMVIGLAGFAALALVVSQWSAMRDETSRVPASGAGNAQTSAGTTSPASALSLIFSPAMVMFFIFFTVLSMMQTGLQAFTATALVALHETPLATANIALSAYLFTSAAGVLIGGEISDRTDRHDLIAGIVFGLSAAIAIALAWFNLQAAVLVMMMALMGVGQGATRPARDMMLRAATPKGATGSVFGFVTSGIAVGSALAPIPLGLMIDIGQPAWVFYSLALLMVLALASMAAQRALRAN